MQKAFEVSTYPTKMPLSAVGSSIVLFLEGRCEKVRQPNTRKWLTPQASFLWTSPQKSCSPRHDGDSCSEGIQLYYMSLPKEREEVIDHVTWLLLLQQWIGSSFMLLYYAQECGTVNCLRMPSCLQYSSNSLEVYSPSLSDLSTWILLPVWFSTRALNSWNLYKTSSDFLLSRK